MTTLLTRLYATENAAKGVMDRLYRAGFPRYMMRIVTAQNGAGTTPLDARLRAARVPDDPAAAYAGMLTETGGALLVVTATYKPLGARKIGLGILEDTKYLAVDLPSQDFKVPNLPDHAPSVLKDCPRFLTSPPDPDRVGGPLSDQFGFSLLASNRRAQSALRNGGHILPFPNLTHGRKAKSAISGGYHVSRAFWPMKLVTNKPRRNSAIRGGGHPFSRLFGLRLVS